MSRNPSSILRVAEENKDRPFLIIPDRRLTLTFGDFHDAALGLACRLKEEGIRRGDRLVALLPNSPEYAVLYFAALYLGATVVTANPSSHARDVEFVIHNSGAKLLVYAAQTKHFLLGPKQPADKIHRWEMPQLHEPLFRLPWSGHSWRPLEDVVAEDVLTIVFTSGTTAAPKAVAHTIGNLLGNAAAFNAAMGNGPQDRYLHLLPMSYSGGFFNVLIAPYLAGSSVVLTPGFGPRTALDFWSVPREHGVNALWLTPAIAGALLKVDRDQTGKTWCRENVKKIFIGTAPLYPQVKREFEAAYGVPLFESYGLSETLLIAGNGPKTGAAAGTVGAILPGVAVSGGEEGELLVKTPHLMAGYLDYETGLVRRPEGEWFPTGDLGAVGADGLLRITGRKKDLIIRGGLNISPLALEAVLLQHEAVSEAAVVGVPNEIVGEDVVAVIKLKPGRRWNEDRPLLEAYCKASFTTLNRPTVLLELDEFPAGPTGKTLKREIRDWAAKQLAAAKT